MKNKRAFLGVMAALMVMMTVGVNVLPALAR